MATVINNPSGTGSSGSGFGAAIAALILIILVIVILAWGLPAIRNARNSGGTTNVQVPDRVNVNTNPR
ncbi:MAG TPA: hypothetical protein VK255_04630 [Patescibacteria group bacterium]|nr:hypothetical protein [Patescibacteria group bacterium]